ncbi:LysR family transcriptional regulator [Ferrimonas futtsuensis]|uniref:LysR family transcriptional regulator n=1 Tax=Ferrimonas futtsuensis TaxID=364764 RepID=UPI0003FE79C7|nr:LysR family transcriptional regulator [Ferrimonas futtsuensis]
MDLNQVRVFVRVAEAGSFVGAARSLGMPPTSVSRKVQQLEADLGVRLLNRSTRKLSLTDVGQRYFQHCQHNLSGLEEAGLLVLQSQMKPTGTIRITAPLDFALMFVQPWVSAFLARHPQVNVELEISDHQVDLIEERIDIAFRSGILKDSSLVARRLMTKSVVCCASPEYLAQHPAPRYPHDLAQHQCVLWGRSLQGHTWQFKEQGKVVGVPVTGRYSADTQHLLIEAALAGLGVAKLPFLLIKPYLEQGQLRPLLREYEAPAGNMYLIHQSHRHVSQAVRLFVDYVVEQMPKPAPG